MLTILVVDDDVDTCRNMTDLFTEFGYQVDAFENGRIALEQARQQAYAMGLLDLRMPDMDGLTLCRRLKDLRPTMVNVIVTGHPGDDLDEAAHAAGARQVLHKPVDFRELFGLVEEVMTTAN